MNIHQLYLYDEKKFQGWGVEVGGFDLSGSDKGLFISAEHAHTGICF